MSEKGSYYWMVLEESRMQVDERKEGNLTILEPRGPLTLDVVDEFYSHALNSIRFGADRLVVDLSAVPRIDSSGLAALIRVQRKVDALGGGVVFLNPSETVFRLFRMTQMDRALIIRRSMEEAHTALDALHAKRIDIHQSRILLFSPTARRQRWFEEALKKHGFGSIRIAGAIHEALEAASGGEFEVAIVDQEQAVPNVQDFLAVIRAPGRQVPIVITGPTPDEMKGKVSEEKADLLYRAVLSALMGEELRYDDLQPPSSE